MLEFRAGHRESGAGVFSQKDNTMKTKNTGPISTEYPRMLYQEPGEHELYGRRYAQLIVNSDDEKAEALASGWHLTIGEASAAHDAEKLKATAGSVSGGGQAGEAAGGKGDGDDDTKPPTREELLAKAKELGIEHHPRLGDEKLAALIAEKLKA